MSTAVVVGSGPNGLAAAIRLAQAGVQVRVLEAADRIGGGARSSEKIVPGLLVDDCSAFHPTGAGSPFLQSLPLGEHGLRAQVEGVDGSHPHECRQVVDVPDEQVGHREGQVGQAEEQQDGVEIEAAEHPDVVKDDPHLAELGEPDEQRAEEIEGE